MKIDSPVKKGNELNYILSIKKAERLKRWRHIC